MRRDLRKPRSHPALKTVLALVLALIATDAWAAVAYKLTDPNGRVTYVDVPPRTFDGTVQRLDIDTDEHVVSLPPAPRVETPSERVIRRAAPVDPAEERLRAARARLAAARAALDEAQNNSTAEDWIYFGPRNPVGMRRAPRPEYQARLERLEDGVRRAEAQLREAERG